MVVVAGILEDNKVLSRNRAAAHDFTRCRVADDVRMDSHGGIACNFFTKVSMSYFYVRKTGL